MFTLVFSRLRSTLGLGILAALFVCSALGEQQSPDGRGPEGQAQSNGLASSKVGTVANPEYWLEKMATAFTDQTYAGTFTYIRGKEFNAMRIVHDASGGEVRESILKLNGPKIEIRRWEDQIVCYHDSDQPGDLRHNVLLGPFSHSFNTRIIESSHFYDLALHGEDRIADRRVIRLSTQPVNADRFGYLLWLDYQTGLLLQSHLVERGRVKEVFAFSDIDFTPDTQLLLTAIDPDRTISHQLADDFIQQDTKPSFKVKWLPDGFKVVRQAGNRLHFSDGIVTFSVFLEPQRGLPNLATEVEGRTIVTRALGNSKGQVTIIGGLPVSTAQRLAESVEPILY